MSARTRLLSIGSVSSAVIGGSLLHPLVTGATSSTTHQGAPIGVGLVPAAAAFIALAVLLGLVAYAPSTVARLARSTGSTARHLAPRPSSVLTVASALLLVSAAAGGGFLGPQAQSAHDDLSPTQEAEAIACGGVCIATGVGIAVGFGAGYVATNYFSGNDEAATYNATADATETHIDLSTHADSLRGASHTVNAIQSNQVNDGSQSVALAKAKATLIEEFQNGTSEQNATDAANATIDEYYATMEENVLQHKNDINRKAAHLDDQYRSQGSLGQHFLYVTQSSGGGHSYDTDSTNLATGEMTLRNGETHNVTSVILYTGNSPDHLLFDWTGEASNFDVNVEKTTAVNGRKLKYEGYDGDGVLFNMENTSQVFSDIDTNANQAQASISVLATDMYANSNSSDFNLTDYVDPTTLYQEMSTDYNTTGYAGYGAAQAALMGYNTTLNHSFVINENGTLHNGTLFTSWEPAKTNGTFETGVEYDPANASVPVFVAKNDEMVTLQEPFTITEMVNVRTGESVNNTTLENYNRQTTDNVTLTQEQLDQLLSISQEVDDAQVAAAGGSGNTQTILLAVAGLAAGLLLMRREQD
ncbi:hypothetical protein [Salinigranum halophilum]|uniref:hypothetical protein n=1 Tax=Salinigranum halophilum TaxID=2565931 RepID=UPI00115C8D85|nr:hypothetical protein [Salinigranum halophilum]